MQTADEFFIAGYELQHRQNAHVPFYACDNVWNGDVRKTLGDGTVTR